MKQCSCCGENNPDTAVFCGKCGSSLNAAGSQKVSPTAKEAMYFPMAWHSFLIYFSLWAGAVNNFFNGVSIMTGRQYRELKDAVYDRFPDLASLDMLIGFIVIALAALCIVTRFQLADFKKNGPKLLVGFYAVSAVLNLVYAAMAESITKIDIMDASTMSSITVGIAMTVANYIYYKKRQLLFVN